MATETVTLTLDAEQYYREIAKVTQSGRGIGRIGDELGAGFLKGERAVGRGTAEMVRGLSQVHSASDAVQVGLIGLERIGRFGLPLAAGIGAAVAIFIKVKGDIDRLKESTQNLNKELNKPFAGSFAGLETQIESTSKAVDDLQAKINTFGVELERQSKKGLLAFLGPLFDPVGNIRGRRTAEPTIPEDAKLIAGQEKLRQAHLRVTEALQDQVRIKSEEVWGDTKLAELLRVRLEGEQKIKDIRATAGPEEITARVHAQEQLNKLAEDEVKIKQQRAKEDELRPVRAATEALDAELSGHKLLSNLIKTESDYEEQILKARREGKQELAALLTLQKNLVIESQKLATFNQFIGGGAAQIIAQQQQAAFERARFEAAQRDFQARIARGAFGQSPLEQLLFGKGPAAAAPAAKDFSGINSLAGQDFTGMASLAGLNFSGLTPLAGLTISIK